MTKGNILSAVWCFGPCIFVLGLASAGWVLAGCKACSSLAGGFPCVPLAGSVNSGLVWVVMAEGCSLYHLNWG